MKLTLIFFICAMGLVSAQNTLQLPQGKSSPRARLQDVAWAQGHWQGEAFGGEVEEIWGPPSGGSMMFMFKLYKDGKVSFYELGHVIEVDNSLVMQLKHFDGELTGWEEKEETVDFPLVRLEKDKVYFEGMTLERIGKDRMNIHVLIEEGEGAEEVLFAYTRKP